MIKLSNIDKEEAADVTEPVLLADAKAWIQVDYTDNDALITSMIKGARQAIEQYTNLALVPKDVTLDVCLTCEGTVRLPYALSVDAVDVLDMDVEGFLDEDDDYTIRGNTVKINRAGNFEISYSVSNTIPEALKEAIKCEVANRYEHRGDTEHQLSEAAKAKADPYVQIWL